MKSHNLPQDALKTCSLCRTDKPLGEFYFSHSIGRYQPRCKLCRKAETREYANRTPKQIRSVRARQYRLKKFGLTIADYDALKEKQGGVCAICLNEENVVDHHGPRDLAVDHDHNNQRVRGLLCYRCNAALGWFKDKADVILSAVLYLESGTFLSSGFPVPNTRYANSDKDRYLKRMYGITELEFNSMVEFQSGKCDICHYEPDVFGFCVDHDHKNGNVRGLLCKGCNTGIGLLREDPDRLNAAADYLERALK